MKKILIPTILAATVLVAGMFALMPVEKASTVHTTILAAISGVKIATFSDADNDWDVVAAQDEIRLTCTAAAVISEISFDIDGTLAAGDNIDLNIDPDGAAAVFAEVSQADFFGNGAPADEATLLATRALHQGVSLDTTGFLELQLTAEAADDNNEDVDVIASYSSSGTCSWGAV